MSDTSDRKAFLRTIVESPDEDAPRLVFADWLDEQGEPARAEFIRVQCELATLSLTDERRAALAQRERALLAEHGERWRAELPALPVGVAWGASERGFAEWIEVGAGAGPDFEPVASAVFAANPGRSLRLARLIDLDTFLAAAPQVTRLDLSGLRMDDWHVSTLVRSPQLANLVALNLSHNFIDDAGVRALAASPHLGRLRTLDLTGNLFGDPGATALRDSPLGRQLATVGLTEVDAISLRVAGELTARFGESTCSEPTRSHGEAGGISWGVLFQEVERSPKLSLIRGLVVCLGCLSLAMFFIFGPISLPVRLHIVPRFLIAVIVIAFTATVTTAGLLACGSGRALPIPPRWRTLVGLLLAVGLGGVSGVPMGIEVVAGTASAGLFAAVAGSRSLESVVDGAPQRLIQWDEESLAWLSRSLPIMWPMISLWHSPNWGMIGSGVGVMATFAGWLVCVATFCGFGPLCCALLRPPIGEAAILARWYRYSTVLLGGVLGGVVGTAIVQFGRPPVSEREFAVWVSVVGCCLAGGLGAAVVRGPLPENTWRVPVVLAAFDRYALSVTGLLSVFAVLVTLRLVWWFWVR